MAEDDPLKKPLTGMPMTPEQMANAALMQHPTNKPPNFDNPDTTGPEAIAILSIFLGLAILVVVMRLISRIKIVKRVGWDDGAAVLSLVFNIATVCEVIYLVDAKILGVHAWDVRLVTFMEKKTLEVLLSLQLMCNLASFFAKMAILLFLQRIFTRPGSPKAAYAVLAGIVVNTVAYLVIIIYTSAVCIPRVGSGGANPPQCTSQLQMKLGVGTAVVNVFLDLYILAVSVPTLWTLQMPTRRKVSIVGVLSVGLAACAVSLVTLSKRITADLTVDPTRKQMFNLIFSILEPIIALITACLPALPALWAEISSHGLLSLRRLLSRISGTTIFSGSKGRSEREQIGEESSLKSLHNRPSDAELGIRTQTEYSVTSKERSVSEVS